MGVKIYNKKVIKNVVALVISIVFVFLKYSNVYGSDPDYLCVDKINESMTASGLSTDKEKIISAINIVGTTLTVTTSEPFAYLEKEETAAENSAKYQFEKILIMYKDSSSKANNTYGVHEYHVFDTDDLSTYSPGEARTAGKDTTKYTLAKYITEKRTSDNKYIYTIKLHEISGSPLYDGKNKENRDIKVNTNSVILVTFKKVTDGGSEIYNETKSKVLSNSCDKVEDLAPGDTDNKQGISYDINVKDILFKYNADNNKIEITGKNIESTDSIKVSHGKYVITSKVPFNYIDLPEDTKYEFKYEIKDSSGKIKQGTATITTPKSSKNPSSSGFWGDAQKWFSKGRVNTNLGEATEAVNDLMDIINITGTTIIMIITTILGIKYIYSSAEGKAEVKKSLTVLLIACVFFFGWQGISNIIMPGNKLVFTSNTNSFKDIANKVFSYFTYISQFVMVAGVIYVGVKYMFSGAEGKADLKSKSMQFIIGIIMSFATVSFLTYISKVINSIV